MLVQGGPAQSGRKRPLREKARHAWRCACEKVHPSYLIRCSTCRVKRDG